MILNWVSNVSAKTPPITFNLQDANLSPYMAPPIQGVDAWLNSAPIDLAALKGKVVLVHFWNTSSPNSIHTLYHVQNWYLKYRSKGLVVIGVFAPEFDAEKKMTIIKSTIAKNKLGYPIALDNKLLTWQKYHTRYLPAQYLIDKNGYVVYQHFGEGNYKITENNIRMLIAAKNNLLLYS